MLRESSFGKPSGLEGKNPLEKVPLARTLLEDAAERIASGRRIAEKDIETGKFDAEIARTEVALKTSFNDHRIEWGDARFQSALEATLSPLEKALFAKMRNVITSREEEKIKNLGALEQEEKRRFNG